MDKKQLCIIFFFLYQVCRKNNPIFFENFQALRFESNIEEKNIIIMFLI